MSNTLIRHTPCSLVVLCFLGTCVASQAAPVRLAFEAEVDEINQDPNPLTLPFSISEGQIIRGTFTFDPVDVDPATQRFTADQPHRATFIIDSFIATSQGYVTESSDDVRSDENPAPQDIIRLNRPLGGNLGDPEMLEWGFAMSFFGDGGVLEGADLPTNVGVWRMFDEQRLRLTFADRTTNDSIIMRAALTRITVVPEPSAGCLCFIVLSMLAINRCRYVSRH